MEGAEDYAWKWGGDRKACKMTKNERRNIRSVLKMKKCRYCFTKENLTIDHVVPISRGGKDDISNMACVCRSCNGIKSSVRHDEILRIVKWWLDIKGFERKGLKPLKKISTP